MDFCGASTNQTLAVLNSSSSTSVNVSIIGVQQVLILTKKSSMIKELIPILEANRVLYDTHYLVAGQKDVLPPETGKYCAIIFTSFTDYFTLNSLNKQLLNEHCKSFGIGLVLFNQGSDMVTEPTGGFPFKVYTHTHQFKSYYVNKNASILHITKPDNTLEADKLSKPKTWSVFVPQAPEYDKQFEIVAISSFIQRPPGSMSANTTGFPRNVDAFPVVVHDLGKQDGIQRVYFGADLTFWLHKVLVLDALGFISGHRLTKPLERWLQIDIDDIFVAKKGHSMKKEDVEALVLTQDKFQKIIPGFHFNLGFCGKHFLNGTEEENEGDKELLKNSNEFWWFDHTWSHKQPHLVGNFDDMKQEILLNLEFAKEHKIAVNKDYSVSPHHSGIYPVHDLLYKAWREVGINVASTEEYPHLKPWWKRRGFIYQDIMVLPRQTCGLWTASVFMKDKEELLGSSYGGELFQLFINNPINIFMTHLPNYGNDRLALYTFTNVIKFVQHWTKLRILSLPPLELGKKYFELRPEEQRPIWENPCTDRFHAKIWPVGKSCRRLPSFIIVGPQKTGTSALHAFLSIHPEILPNRNNDQTFEETQFFSSDNYYKGLNWYMKLFPDVSYSTLIFEKSATYFDSHQSPMRAYALIPNAKIIAILIDPARRAYSWFQHQRSHSDDVALSMNFYDLLNCENATGAVHNLRKRVLVPGLYAEHLEKWLTYYPSLQILVIDGGQLRDNPAKVMAEVQSFIQVKTVIDYETKLRYNERKGFYCFIKSGGPGCLGPGKGRKYPAVDKKSEDYLRNFYREPNRRLVELLHKIRQPIPHWLSRQVASSR